MKIQLYQDGELVKENLFNHYNAKWIKDKIEEWRFFTRPLKKKHNYKILIDLNDDDTQKPT